VHLWLHPQHELAGGRFLWFSPDFYTGFEVVINRFFKGNMQLFYCVGMKSDNIVDAPGNIFRTAESGRRPGRIRHKRSPMRNL
jgi:hypothetical protein